MKMKFTSLMSLLVFISLSLSTFAAAPKQEVAGKAEATAETTKNATESATTTETVKWVNDKLQAALADLITKSVSVAGDAKDFVIGQLPDVIKQLLLWKLWESLAPMLIALTFLLVFSYKFRRSCKQRHFDKGKRKSRDNNGQYPYIFEYPNGSKVGYFLGFVYGVLSGLSLLILVCTLNLTWLQIWLAPKVYLIEYSKALIQSVTK